MDCRRLVQRRPARLTAHDIGIGNVAAEQSGFEAADIPVHEAGIAYGTVTAVVEKHLLRSQRIAVTENILIVVLILCSLSLV